MKKSYILLMSIFLFVISLFSCPNKIHKVSFMIYNTGDNSYTEAGFAEVKDGELFSSTTAKRPTNTDFDLGTVHYELEYWTNGVPADLETPTSEGVKYDEDTPINSSVTLYAVYNSKTNVKFIWYDSDNRSYTKEESITVSCGTQFKDILNKPEPKVFLINNDAYVAPKWTESVAESEVLVEKEEVSPEKEINTELKVYAFYTKEAPKKLNLIYLKDAEYKKQEEVKFASGSYYSDLKSKLPTLSTSTSEEYSGVLYTFTSVWDKALDPSDIQEDFMDRIINDDTVLTEDTDLFAVYTTDEYLAFTNVASFDSLISFKIVGTLSNSISLQYRLEGDKSFKDYKFGESEIATSGNGEQIVLKKQKKIYFRGDNSTFSTGENGYVQLVANSSSARFKASGSVMSVLNQRDTIPNDFCFFNFLRTFLTQAPSFPAKNLKHSCYKMTLAYNSSLTTAPELRATTLAMDCYRGMFKSCSTLVNPPELKATNVQNGCYRGMFEGCISLEKAPELPASTLIDHCYNSMFLNCSKLNEIKIYATSISAPKSLESWVSGVNSTGSFYHDQSVTFPVGVSGIPTNFVDMPL